MIVSIVIIFQPHESFHELVPLLRFGRQWRRRPGENFLAIVFVTSSGLSRRIQTEIVISSDAKGTHGVLPLFDGIRIGCRSLSLPSFTFSMRLLRRREIPYSTDGGSIQGGIRIGSYLRVGIVRRPSFLFHLLQRRKLLSVFLPPFGDDVPKSRIPMEHAIVRRRRCGVVAGTDGTQRTPPSRFVGRFVGIHRGVGRRDRGIGALATGLGLFSSADIGHEMPTRRGLVAVFENQIQEEIIGEPLVPASPVQLRLGQSQDLGGDVSRVKGASEHGDSLSGAGEVPASEEDVALDDGFGEEGDGSVVGGAEGQVVFGLGVVHGGGRGEDEGAGFEDLEVGRAAQDGFGGVMGILWLGGSFGGFLG
mmetsp:Transcript_12433/g.26230  ORF Transcript_12433/g.26230 Transcript_12433/m.26230 type:complete len:363 (-) Transcript_12433:1254-2342(-)